MDLDTGFKDTTRVIVNEVINQTLIGKCGYRPREIVIFGFGQGGMAGLATLIHLSGTELGGLISIGGILPDSCRISAAGRCKTPVLVCGGDGSTAVTTTAVEQIKNAFEYVEVRNWKKIGDGMPANREEMMPIMTFFARRLKSMKGVPEGSVEIGSR